MSSNFDEYVEDSYFSEKVKAVLEKSAQTMIVYSRPNDPNGNPYRLITVFGRKGKLLVVFEARDSSPNIVRVLERIGVECLDYISLEPGVYKSKKFQYTQMSGNIIHVQT